MVKTFLILIILQIFLFANEQIILVISDDFNDNKATLSCFEDGKKVFEDIKVNLGKNGLGWGIGLKQLKQKTSEPLKYEGDKKAPAGIFKLTHIFGYKKQHNFKMPYLYANKSLICIDDSNHKNYNQILQISHEKPKSFEFMKRDDNQYELGIVVEHNKNQLKQRGSCIFLHIEKFKGASTAGCTSMSLENIKRITSWLDINKHPILIQIPKSRLHEIQLIYPELQVFKLISNF